MSEPAPRPPVPTPAQLKARLETYRREFRLPDDALVLRGGTLQRGDLERAVIKARRVLKRAGLSVNAAEVPSPASLYLLRPPPHPMLSFTTVGRLREKGFDIEQTREWPHHTVWFPEDDEEDDGFWIQMFQSAFDDPVSVEDLPKYRVSDH